MPALQEPLAPLYSLKAVKRGGAPTVVRKPAVREIEAWLVEHVDWDWTGRPICGIRITARDAAD